MVAIEQGIITFPWSNGWLSRFLCRHNKQRSIKIFGEAANDFPAIDRNYEIRSHQKVKMSLQAKLKLNEMDAIFNDIIKKLYTYADSPT